MANPVATFFRWVGTKIAEAWAAANTLERINMVLSVVTLAVGVKGYMQARQMLAKGQDILANKTSAGGKIPVIYGTRRVGAQVVYMDVSNNDSRHLFVVYALSVGEVDEILGKTIQLDGNPLTDSARFKYGSYIGSDKISSGSGSLNTVSQVGSTISAGAGGFGTSPTSRYRITFNLHHGAATQTADPMLVASMPNWTSAHKLNGIAYIAAHYKYDKEGMFAGVPQLTVQVRGKKVYDPRDSGQTFGTVSTYEYSSNPALCFLDFITNNEYGKGLTESQINMSTFSSAANVCDTEVDNPFFNGVAKSLTWSGVAGDNFITIEGTTANDDWWQNKIGELINIYDNNGDGVLTDREIADIQRDEFFNENPLYRVYLNAILDSTYTSQTTGSYLVKVKRFHCNGYLDTNKNVMDNAKELLANMRGIFLYIDGKYELQIEDTGSSSFTITDDHIIADAGISVDYGNKDKKANKVIVEFFNANKRYELDTATVLHDATPNYYSDDNDEILEIKAEFPYVTDPYIAYNMAKAILVRSRKQMTIQFLGTPEMYKLNVGDIVTLNYAGTFDTSQTCRVEALELQPNGLVAVSLIEYFDVYTWETPPEEPLEELANLPSAYAVKAPTGLTFTDSNSSSTDRPILSWDAPTDYPDYEFRVNVVDSSGNQLINRIVNTTEAELNFTPTGSNYVASVTSLNTLGTESDASTLTFSVSTAPVGLGDIQADAVTANTIDVNELSAISADMGTITAGSIDIGSGAFSVTSAGVLDATGATIGGDFSAGSGNDIFKADSNGIYLGNATFANAPFKVLSSGEVQTTKSFTAGVAGTDAIAKMSGTGDYRFWSGNETPSNASFSVDKDGKAIARNLVLKLTDGTVYFDSETGFSSSALSQISTSTGTKVSTVSSTFDADTEYEEITVTANTTVNVSVSIDTNFGGVFGNATESTAIDSAEAQVPANFTLTIEHSSDGGSNYNTVVTDEFSRVETTPASDEYKINTDTQELFISGGGGVIYLATTTTSLNLGCVDSDGRTTLSYTGLSLSGTTSGTTHRIRASVSSTDTNDGTTTGTPNYDSVNNNVTSTTPRVLSVTDPSGNGFYVDDGSGSTVPPEGDITAVQITTASTSGLTGGANFTSGDATFTLALASNIDGARTFTNNVVIQGDLDVQGTTTTIDTANLDVKDKNITLNYGTGDTSANANGAGITIQDAVSAGNDATLTWNTSDDSFNFSHDVNVSGAITSTSTSEFPSLNLGGVNSTASSFLSGTQRIVSDGYIATHAIYNYGETGTAPAAIVFGSGSTYGSDQISLITAGVTRLYIGSAGDISFYEDTGTTAKFFWDASAESLGIGLTNQSEKLHIYGTGATISAKVEAGDGNQASLDLKNSEGEFRLINDGGELYVYDSTDAAERFRINTSGNATFSGTISSSAITSTGASSGRYTGLEVVNTTNAAGTETAIGLGVVSASNSSCDVKLVANRVGANSGSDFYIEQTDSSGTQQETFRITESGNATFAGTIDSGAITITSSGTIGGSTLANAYLTLTDGSITMGFDGNEIHTTDDLYLLAEAGNIIFRDTSNAGVILKNGSTQFMDTSLNLSNIGTISSGQINATTTADATPAIIATNTGGLNATIQRWVGDSNGMELRNDSSTGDYKFVNNEQDNGFLFYDGVGGIDVLYNGSVVQSWDSSGGTDLFGDFKVGGTTIIQSSGNNLVNIGVVTATGLISTDSHVQSGDGSGGVALTINDGYGNANVTWNHLSGVPEQNGNSARIEVNTDATSAATMYFELKSGVTSGVAVQTDSIMLIDDTGLQIASGKTIRGNGELTLSANDVDFIVSDTTDTMTHFIWRDHSASKLYLGTADAVATLRSTLDLNSNNITNAGTIDSGVITSTISGTSGNLITFNNSNGEIGSIETQGDEMVLMSVDRGLRIRTSAVNSIIPVGTARTSLDATIDLGSSAARFKDLYLSGSITSGAITSSGASTFSSSVNIDNTLNLDARGDGSQEKALAFKDSVGNYSISHNVNDGNGNYSISIGYKGDGNGQYVVTGDGVGKILFGGHGVDGYVSLNAAQTGTASNDISFTMGLVVDHDSVRVGASANGTGLTDGAGTKVFDASGNAFATSLEIGSIETTTNFPLLVKSGTNDHAIAIEEASGAETWQLGVDSAGSLRFYNSGATTSTVVFNDAGDVGIGVQSPDALLHLSGGTTEKIILEDSASPRQNYIGFSSSDNLEIAADEDNLGTDSSIRFRIDADEKARITANGILGIGITPSTYLTNGYVLRLQGTTQTYISFNNSTHTTQVVGGFAIGHDASAARIIQRENQPMIFSTNNIDALTIGSDQVATFASSVYLEGGGIAISFNGTGTDANYRNFAYEGSGNHYVTNRHTDGDLVLMSNNGTGGGETTRMTLQSGSGTQDIDITNANLDLNSNNINSVGALTTNDITKIVASPLVMGTGSSYQNYVVDGTSQAYQYLDTRDYMVSKGHHAGATYVIGGFSGSNHIVVPYVDGTDIFVDGVVSVPNASANTAYTISASELSAFSEITADKPIAVSKTDPSSPVMNTNYAGRVLGLFVSRYQPIDIYVYSPFTKVTVEFYRKSSAPVDASSSSSGDFIYSTTIDAGSGFQFQEDVHSTQSSGDQYFIVKADGLICAESIPSGGDYTLLSPAGMELVGSATYSPQSFGYTESSVTSSLTTVSNGSATYYRDNTGKNGIFAYGTADGAGGDAEFAVPIEYLSDYYIYPEGDITNFRLVSYKTNTIKVLDSSGTVLYTYDHRAATKSAPIFAQEGAESGSGGALSSNGPFRFIGTAPFHLVCQNSADDEMVQLGAMQRELFTSNNRGFKSSFGSPAGTTSPFNATANTLTLPAAIYHQHGIVTGADLAVIDLETGVLEISSQGEIVIAADAITASKIASNTITGEQINANLLNVQHFDNVSADIKSHLTTETFVPLSRDGQAYVQRTGTYTGSNASFIPVTITQVRNNASYVAIFSGVLGDVSGGRVQYSLNNSTWVNANGNTNISWSAGTYRGYTYVYTGQITTLSNTQSTVYWRVYFSGSYNHTQLSLNVMMDNTQ